MNEDRILELLSAAADDDLSPDEQVQLDNLLREFPDAARIQAELAQLDDVLAQVPNVEPPAGLHDRIMSSVTLPAPRADRGSRPTGDWWATIRPGAVLRHAFSMAVGVMLAVSVYESQPKFAASTDISELVGTMAPDAGPAGRRILDSLTVSAAGVSSVARLEQRDDTLVLDIRIDTTRALDIAIDFGGTELEFKALAQTLSSLDSIEYANQVLKVRGQGQRRFAVLMESGIDASAAEGSRIHLEYSSDGAVLQQGALSSAR